MAHFGMATSLVNEARPPGRGIDQQADATARYDVLRLKSEDRSHPGTAASAPPGVKMMLCNHASSTARPKPGRAGGCRDPICMHNNPSSDEMESRRTKSNGGCCCHEKESVSSLVVERNKTNGAIIIAAILSVIKLKVWGNR